MEIARQKAETAGRNLECGYETANGDFIQWKYDGILTGYENDNDVIFARFLRNGEIAGLKRPFKD